MAQIETSKKESILSELENIIKNIKTTNVAFIDENGTDVYYNNDVGYVDRQFINITPNDIETKANNWIIINEKKHEWKALVGGEFENKLQVQILAYCQVNNIGENLSTLMNSLHKDIFTAILKSKELNGKCDYIVPKTDYPADNMIHPYGGYISNFEIVYTTQNLDY